MGVIQNYGTPRFREPFAPFRTPAESGHGIMIRFSCAISSHRFTRGLYLKHSFGHLPSGHWFCTHSLKSFWSCDIAERTSPFWARVGSGRIRLSRTFRGPFANLSRISRLKNEISETNVYARVSFIIYANHAGCHCQLSEHGTIRNMNPVAILQGKLPNMNTIYL